MKSATNTRRFQCIYCGHCGPRRDFDNEHVFPRALCGIGTNWTLVNRVCKTCNNRFSKYETELLQQSAESIARGFSGPIGRGARNAEGARIQPLKINHIYALNANDPLVYEGGFSFPSEFYFRPQMVEVGDGTICSVIGDRNEMPAFQDALFHFVREPRRITLPRPKNRKEYEIVLLTETGGHWRPGRGELNREPSDVIFREIIRRDGLPPITARVAQNDDGKLFFRAPTLNALGLFMDLMFAGKQAEPRPSLPQGQGQQVFFFGLTIDLNKVFKAVLKTGLNFVAYACGDDALRNPAFDRARGILLNVTECNRVATICEMSPGVTSDFPSVSGDSHQMMLDQSDGFLRFRMRLYNSFG